MPRVSFGFPSPKVFKISASFCPQRVYNPYGSVGPFSVPYEQIYVDGVPYEQFYVDGVPYEQFYVDEGRWFPQGRAEKLEFSGGPARSAPLRSASARQPG